MGSGVRAGFFSDQTNHGPPAADPCHQADVWQLQFQAGWRGRSSGVRLEAAERRIRPTLQQTGQRTDGIAKLAFSILAEPAAAHGAAVRRNSVSQVWPMAGDG